VPTAEIDEVRATASYLKSGEGAKVTYKIIVIVVL
jgi:hypothetical protein